MKNAMINLITRTPLSRKIIPQIISNKDNIIVNFCIALKSNGINVDLFISDAYKPVIEERLDIKTIYLKTLLKRIFLPSRLPFVPSLFLYLRNKYDNVICVEAFQWSTVIAVVAKLFSFRRKMSIYVLQELSRHNKYLLEIPSRIYYGPILKYLLDKHIRLYIPFSERSRNFLLANGIKKEKIGKTISHGYNHNVFFPENTINESENYIFAPLILINVKGVDTLLKAFSIVRKQNPDVELIIQGDGPEFNNYENMARNLNILEKVKFNRERISHNKMRTLYNRALITVIPSRKELCNLSLRESIACGTPVIVSDGTDNFSIFDDGKGGLIFKKGDYVQLSELITKMIGDHEYRKAMRKWALKKAEMFTQENISKLFAEMVFYNNEKLDGEDEK